MEVNRRRRVPGISEHIKLINQNNEEINKTTELINSYKEKVTAEITKEKETSAKAQLYQKKDAAEKEIKDLLHSRSLLFNQKDEIVSVYQKDKEELLSEKKKMNVENIGEIEKKEADIKFRMLSAKMSSQQEKLFAAQLAELSRKRKVVGFLKEKEDRVREMDKKLKELNEQIKGVNGSVKEKRDEIVEIKGEIEKINEKGKGKSDVVLELEGRIEELKKKKQEFISKKRVEQEEIKKKEAAYEKHLEEVAKQAEIETKKKNLKGDLRDCEEQRNALVEQRGALDPKKYDSIIEAVKKLRGCDRRSFSIPLSLIQLLAESGVAVPKSEGDVSAVVGSLEAKQRSFTGEIGVRLKEIDRKIEEVDKKVVLLKEELEKMPATEAKIASFNKR